MYIKIIALFLLSLSTAFAGHRGDTLINTGRGILPISKVVLGDRIVTPDEMYVRQKHLILGQRLCVICLLEEKLYVTHDQHFFDLSLNDWVEAQDLDAESVLIDKNGDDVQVLKVKILDELCDVYDLSLDEPHMYFIGRSQVLVHNVVPLVVLAPAAPAVGKGAVVLGVMTCVAAKGIWDWCCGWDDHKKALEAQKMEARNMRAEAIAEAHELELIRSGKKKAPAPRRFVPNNQPNAQGPQEPGNKPRIVNEMSKAAFFKSVADEYERWKDGIYKLVKGAEGLVDGKAHYLYWDHLHNEVEAFTRGEVHLGALDPALKVIYKNAGVGRRFPGK